MNNFTLPDIPNDVKINNILLEFHNGTLTNCFVRGNLMKDDITVKSGDKDIIKDLPVAHKTQYETYLAIYTNSLKTLLGL